MRETIPDYLLRRADEVVNVDVSVETLRTRLRQGKIYDLVKIGQALNNFSVKEISRLSASLTASTIKIAAGDLDARVTISSRDEVGVLAAEYNRMATRVLHSSRTTVQ